MCGKNLYGNATVQPRVPRAVHLAHSASAERSLDLVRSQFLVPEASPIGARHYSPRRLSHRDSKKTSRGDKIGDVTGWDEKGGLRTGGGVRSQVIDVLEAQIKRRPAMKKVSTVVTQQGRNFSQPTSTIGLDLGDRNSWYCVVDESGQIQLEQRVRTNAKALREVFGSLPRSRVALETGTRLPLDQPSAERTRTRSHRGACPQGTADRRESKERKSPGCADSGTAGTDRPAVALSGEASQCPSPGGLDVDSSASRTGAIANRTGEHSTQLGQKLRRTVARLQCTQHESGKSRSAESGAAKCSRTPAGRDRVLE